MKKAIFLCISMFFMMHVCYAQTLPNTSPWPSSGSVGIGTTSPAYNLDVNGSARIAKTTYLNNGAETHYQHQYAVPTATKVAVNLTDIQPVLVPGYVYRILLNIVTTSTVTGAVYIVYQTTATTWAYHMVSANGNTSNHPLLLVSNDTVYVYHNHPSLYTINTHVFGFFDGNTNETAPTFFGTDGVMTNFEGNIGIGTESPDQKLSVDGTVHAKSVMVNLTNLPDYVFKDTYRLRPLSEVKFYINQNHHLPEMPTADEVEKNGLNLGETDRLLLKKVEELTLYLIQKDDQISRQHKEINDLKTEMKEIESKLAGRK